MKTKCLSSFRIQERGKGICDCKLTSTKRVKREDDEHFAGGFYKHNWEIKNFLVGGLCDCLALQFLRPLSNFGSQMAVAQIFIAVSPARVTY